MAEPEDLTLLQLRELRQAIADLAAITGESRRRDQSIERQLAGMHAKLAGMHAEIAGMHADTVGVTHQLDAIRDPLERIERRLGLVDAST